MVLALLFVGTLTLLVARSCGDPGVDLLRAEVADSVAADWKARADADSVENVVLRERADFLARVYSTDSLTWAAEADEARARAARATRRASEVAADLTARLDSVGEALFAEYRAERDSIKAADESRIMSLEAERSALWLQRDELGALVDGLTSENTALRQSLDAAKASNEALRDAIAKGSRQNRLLKIGGAALLGLAVWGSL